MHPLRHIAELFHVAATHLECRQPPSSPFDGVPNQLTQVLKELKRMSDTFDTELTKLRNDVAAQSTVIASATAAFTGLAAQLAAAEASAKNAGATDKQISAVSAVRQGLESNTAALSAAIPQNTPAATPAPSEPTTDVPTSGSKAEPTPVAVAPADINPAMPPA